MYNLATCELDQRRHLVTDVRTMIHGVIYLSGHRVSPLEDVTSQHMLCCCCCCCCWCCCCCCCSRSRSRSHSCSHSRSRSHSRSCSCCFADSTCHQPVMAASSLQELAAMHNLTPGVASRRCDVTAYVVLLLLLLLVLLLLLFSFTFSFSFSFSFKFSFSFSLLLLCL